MARQNMNDGTRDIGSASAPILLFRGLDPLSGPQAIAQAMLSSSGPGKPGAKGMKRIILIKDKVTMASFGFAFVEFIDVQVRCKRSPFSQLFVFTTFASLHQRFWQPLCLHRYILLAFEYQIGQLLPPSLTPTLSSLPPSSYTVTRLVSCRP